MKDIAFLKHEPLLEKFREMSKKNKDLAERLLTRKPTYTLDMLIRERYPKFIDALRDLDDCLTMVHLFAALPAIERESIQPERIHNCRGHILPGSKGRESLLFVITSFGGVVSWEGDGAPFEESNRDIDYQPQWVFDCINNARIILPTEDYLVGKVLPPHLSPFVDNEAEGYVPKAEAKEAAERKRKMAIDEKQFHQELKTEMKGMQKTSDTTEIKKSGEEDDADDASPKQLIKDDESRAMVTMSRRKQRLLAKKGKKANIDTLEKRNYSKILSSFLWHADFVTIYGIASNLLQIAIAITTGLFLLVTPLLPFLLILISLLSCSFFVDLNQHLMLAFVFRCVITQKAIISFFLATHQSQKDQATPQFMFIHHSRIKPDFSIKEDATMDANGRRKDVELKKKDYLIWFMIRRKILKIEDIKILKIEDIKFLKNEDIKIEEGVKKQED
ncbi:pescadillo [Tanacetum coccineum]